MEGGWRSSQFKAIPSLLPLVLPHPQNCGSLGCSEQGEGGSSGRAPCSLPPSSGPPPCPVPLLTPLSSLPLSLISSPFPLAFLPPSAFLLPHPPRLHRLATPPASPTSPSPLLPPSPPLPSIPFPSPPALRTSKSKLSGFTSHEPGRLFFCGFGFFCPVLWPKSWETLPVRPSGRLGG